MITIENPKLIQSYVLNKYFVSTALREGSDMYETKYFETLVWEWDAKTKERGELLPFDGHGRHVRAALAEHVKIIQELMMREIEKDYKKKEDL